MKTKTTYRKLIYLSLFFAWFFVQTSCKSEEYTKRVEHIQKLYAPPFVPIKANTYIWKYYLVTGKYPEKQDVVNVLSKYDSILFKPGNFYYKADTITGKLSFYSFFPSGKNGKLKKQIKTPLLSSVSFDKKMYKKWDYFLGKKINMDFWPSNKTIDICSFYNHKFYYKPLADSNVYNIYHIDKEHKLLDIFNSLHMINKEQIETPGENNNIYTVYRYSAKHRSIQEICKGKYVADKSQLTKLADSIQLHFPDIEYLVFDLENYKFKNTDKDLF